MSPVNFATLVFSPLPPQVGQCGSNPDRFHFLLFLRCSRSGRGGTRHLATHSPPRTSDSGSSRPSWPDRGRPVEVARRRSGLRSLPVAFRARHVVLAGLAVRPRSRSLRGGLLGLGRNRFRRSLVRQDVLDGLGAVEPRPLLQVVDSCPMGAGCDGGPATSTSCRILYPCSASQSPSPVRRRQLPNSVRCRSYRGLSTPSAPPARRVKCTLHDPGLHRIVARGQNPAFKTRGFKPKC